MFDWLKQTLGIHGSANHEAVPDGVIDAIARDLGRIRNPGDGVLEAALRYIVEGVGDVPAALRARSRTSLVYSSARQSDVDQRNVRWEIYDAWDRLPPQVLIRFGNVLSASSNALAQSRLILAQKHPWIEALALDLLGMPLEHFSFEAAKVTAHPLASTARLEALLVVLNEDPIDLVASAFHSASVHRYANALYVRELPGFGASLQAAAKVVRPTFRAKSFEHRLHALTLLEKVAAEQLAPFAEELVLLALDSSRAVRQAAIPLALRLGEPALVIARRFAEEQKPEQRALALKLLWESGSAQERELVTTRGEKDGAESVRKIVQQLISGEQAATGASSSSEIPEGNADLSLPLSATTREALRATLERINELIEARRRETAALGHKWGNSWVTLSAGDMEVVLKQVAGPAPDPLETCSVTLRAAAEGVSKALAAWMAHEDVRLTHVVRLLISLRCIQLPEDRIDHVATHMLTEYGRSKPDASLLDLAALLQACGGTPQLLMREWYGRYGRGFMARWPAAAVWPWFARHREMIDLGLSPSSSLAKEYWFERSRVFDALEMFPEVPADLVPKLLELALGSGKADRAGAQRALSRQPGKEEHLIQALTSGKAEARTAASNWLGQLRHMPAIPHIERALAKEKNDAAAGAHMSALELLGVAVDRFLNRDGLQKDAVRALAKGIPTDLQWFPFAALPAVHWDDNGTIVPTESLRWLIVQSFKLKSPEPGGVLRKYCASFRRAEREALGLCVLNAWIRQDLEPSVVSAIASKGILAVAGACGGPEVAPIVQKYLKEYYGLRAAQGRSLIQMLAWVEHPTATQVVLSVGSRFRTKGFQEEATRQAQLLAERKSWTLDELADRTIPTAGLAEDATYVIDYGTRQFTARLAEDLTLDLYSPEGKKLASLPDARQDEDEARIKDQKKQLTAAKKELKGVLKLQRERLYEGLCTQRRWKAEDWTLYLNRHPIVRRYCQQLVWLALRADRQVGSFRPLDDGTLTDFSDNTFELAPDVDVALAHESNVTQADTTAWLKHLEDYRVIPLFQQFGKESYRLPDDKRGDTSIDEFKGVVLNAFNLRNRATALGYLRGATEDGGWFYRYEKRFPTLGITANIEFTGNGMPEENRPVALVSLWFADNDKDSYGAGKRSLGAVPAVLLSECWNDLRTVAAEGKFDADWEKKVAT